MKSDLSGQWGQVVEKAAAVKSLRVLERKYTLEQRAALQQMHPGETVIPLVSPGDDVKAKEGGVPFIGVGFDGWADLDAVRERAREVGSVLVVRHALFAGNGNAAKGPLALLMFLEYLSRLIQSASVTIFPAWHYGIMADASRRLAVARYEQALKEAAEAREQA